MLVLTINIHFEPTFMAPLEAISGKQCHLTLSTFLYKIILLFHASDTYTQVSKHSKKRKKKITRYVNAIVCIFFLPS